MIGHLPFGVRGGNERAGAATPTLEDRVDEYLQQGWDADREMGPP